MTALVMLLLIVVTLLGAPLFAVIGAGAFMGFQREGVDLSVVAIEFFGLSETPVLVAIPLFTFAGFLLSAGQAPARLVRLSQALLGWLPGGLAIISLVACAIFTAFTGASGVTIIALGALLYPALSQVGYDDRFNLGLITSSGSLGLLFAPSLPLILYGIVAQNVAIEDLFIGGVLPGDTESKDPLRAPLEPPKELPSTPKQPRLPLPSLPSLEPSDGEDDKPESGGALLPGLLNPAARGDG